MIIVGPRGSGRTTALIEYAGELQDDGHSILFLVPEFRWINHVYPLLVHTLDMSRVEVHVQYAPLRAYSRDWVIVCDDFDLFDGVNRDRLTAHKLYLAAIVEEG